MPLKSAAVVESHQRGRINCGAIIGGKFLEKFEWYLTGESTTTYKELYSVNWACQTFTVGTVGRNLDFQVTQARLRMYRVGNPSGLLTFSIRNTDANGKPTGSDLCVASINCGDILTNVSLVTLPFSPPFTILKRKTQYALVARAPSADASNYIVWRENVPSPTYAGGQGGASDDSGVTWYVYSWLDMMFEIWGIQV